VIRALPILLLACVACGDDDATPTDAGPADDSGTGGIDAGGEDDAGVEEDAGLEDAGPVGDAGSTDAGPADDAGAAGAAFDDLGYHDEGDWAGYCFTADEMASFDVECGDSGCFEVVDAALCTSGRIPGTDTFEAFALLACNLAQGRTERIGPRGRSPAPASDSVYGGRPTHRSASSAPTRRTGPTARTSTRTSSTSPGRTSRPPASSRTTRGRRCPPASTSSRAASSSSTSPRRRATSISASSR